MPTFQIPMTDEPCPRCLQIWQQGGNLAPEMVMPLPAAGFAPRARDGSGPCCFDCASADGLASSGMGMTFEMARLAVGNDREISYRLPGIEMGLVRMGRMRPPHDTLEEHLVWVDRVVIGSGG